MDLEAIYAAVEDADDEELHALCDHISQVLEKRRLAAESPERIDRMIEDYQATLGRAGGDPWKPPTSALDTYPRGAVHSHPHQGEDRLWESLISANSHEPGVSGWRLVPKKDEDGREVPPPYVAPSGAHDAYQAGERITWEDGHVYAAARDGVVHSPDEYAADWQLIEPDPEPEPEPEPPEEEEPVDPEEPGDGDEDDEPEPEQEPDEPALPEWKVGVEYQPGDAFTYQGHEYRVVQAHTSAAHWPPDQVASLYERQEVEAA